MQYGTGAAEPHVATEPLKCGLCGSGTKFLLLFNFNFNSHVWLVATVLDNEALRGNLALAEGWEEDLGWSP